MPQPAASLSQPVPSPDTPMAAPSDRRSITALALLSSTLLLTLVLGVPLLWLGVPWLVLLLTIATPALILSLA